MRTLSHAHAVPEAHGIDLAPMLDFVTNLLIFLIITAVFVRQAGVEVSRPTNVEANTESSSKVIVIDERGDISIDAKLVDIRAVRAHIEQFRATTANGGMLIIADDRAPTGAVVTVVDEIHLGGIADITFTTQAPTQ
jgi:biopolymer transport protein ExbD